MLASSEVVRSHVGWDRGAVELARHLAVALGAPLLEGVWTRLWVDLNRGRTHPGVVPVRLFDLDIPGNLGLSDEARRSRIDRVWVPFRETARRAVAEGMARNGRCVHLSVHSFAPELDPVARGFPVGVLFDPSRRWESSVAGTVLEELRAHGLDARANQPYLGADDGHTTDLRQVFPDPAYAGIEVELNQAWIGQPADLDHVTEGIIRACRRALGV